MKHTATGLANEIAMMLAQGGAVVPERSVTPLAGGGSLFCMPATDGTIAIVKTITYTPGNARLGRAAIQGDVLVFDVASGRRLACLDGPTVTAQRTAAVSLLAYQTHAAHLSGPVAIIGAGVQGKAHLEAFHDAGFKEFYIASKRIESAKALASHAQQLGAQAHVLAHPHEAQRDCPILICATPAQAIVVNQIPVRDTFLCAVGSFTPTMAEIAPEVVRWFHEHGQIVLDTDHAHHEAGDLIQAGLGGHQFAALTDGIPDAVEHSGSVFFKSCGWAGWDLAAARYAIRAETSH